jgi:hypothetical protein
MKKILHLALAALALTASTLHAQPYPNKPVKVIITYPAGGPADQIARELANGLSQNLGQTFVIEPKAGASGSIGTSFVAKSAPDGYTLLVGAGAIKAIVFGSIEIQHHPTIGFDAALPSGEITHGASTRAKLAFGHNGFSAVASQNLTQLDAQNRLASIGVEVDLWRHTLALAVDALRQIVHMRLQTLQAGRVDGARQFHDVHAASGAAVVAKQAVTRLKSLALG